MGDIVMIYKGAEYRLPETKFFAVGAKIEDVARLFEIMSYRTNPHFHNVAQCIAIMLNAAGAKAKPEEVYRELMAPLSSGGASDYLMNSLWAIVEALFDGAPTGEGGGSGEPTPAS